MPTRDSVTAGAAGDLIKLTRKHPEARVMFPLGIYIAALRQMVAETALQMGASHVLFLDADMRFPEDTLERLLAIGPLPVVAANYVQRTMADWWVARVDGRPFSSAGRSGSQPVESVGMGCALIDIDVFRKLLKRPFFDTPYGYDPAARAPVFLGEDVYFCRQVNTTFPGGVWVDHDLSQRVRHQGLVELGICNSAEPVSSL